MTFRVLEVLNALERCFLAGESPGVKFAAGIAVELITGGGIYGRPLPARSSLPIKFAVSVTLLSSSMDEVLLRRVSQKVRLPRKIIESESGTISSMAHTLSCAVSGDSSAELALLGRPLAVELWDDFDDQITVGLNYLAISRAENPVRDSLEWEFTSLKNIDLRTFDQRECLALSEMLFKMGVTNPYENAGEMDTSSAIVSSAAS